MNPARQALSRSAMESAPSPRHRLLIPLTADEDSRWGVAYARHLQAAGREVEVCFLNVGEAVTSWELLRSRTQAEIAAFQAERAEAFAEEAARPLVAEGIAHRALFRRGEIVFTILDVAEELACNEIVMPPPHRGMLGCLSRNLVAEVQRAQRMVPVVIVDAEGRPADAKLH